jgi:Mlc titration factor MtfA (ptsG expression regulator)/transglutaminase-like putative cysteine protease
MIEAGDPMETLTDTPSRIAVGLSLAGFALAILLNAHHVAWWVLPITLAAAAWRARATWRSHRLPGTGQRVSLMLILLAGVLLSLRSVGGLGAGATLLAAMAAAKLTETRHARDWYIMIGSSLFLVVTACLDRQQLWRLPLYGGVIWVLVCALRALGGGAAGPEPMQWRAAGRALLYSLPLAALLFVFFPRLPGAFWALPRDGDAITGLSDEMSPGSISQLSESDEEALRVRFQGDLPPPESRYWRGPVLHDFDGYTWRRALGEFGSGPELAFAGPAYSYEVTLEPNAHGVLIALELPVAAPDNSVYSGDYQLWSPRPVAQARSYALTSRLVHRDTRPLTTLTRSRDLRPAVGRNPRAVELARSLRSASADDEAFVAAVLDHFRRGGYQYTLTPPRLSLNSVDDFMFGARQGFCGHFASAFVTLMRAGGVPARVVTGYLGGEWNPIGGYLVVRQSHAHAWAEVWIEGRGWVREDPTAVVAPERLTRDVFDLIAAASRSPGRVLRQLPWLGQAVQAIEALNAWWQDEFVGFNFQRQLAFMQRLGLDERDWRTLATVIGAGGFLWLAWIAWSLRDQLRPLRRDELGRLWRRLEARLARAGWSRSPQEGPLAFAARLGSLQPSLAAPLAAAARRYADLRFGPPLPAAAAAAQLRALRGLLRTLPLSPTRDGARTREWHADLEAQCALYRRAPPALREQAIALAEQLIRRKHFVGCNGLQVTVAMKRVIAFSACMLVVRHGLQQYESLRSVLIYPGEFIVESEREDEAGVVSTSRETLSGQAIDVARIVLSWPDVLAAGEPGSVYNVVIHEFAHHLDHALDDRLSSAGSEPWHALLQREYAALCSAVDHGAETLIDPYGAEDPAEFFAVLTETFIEQPRALRDWHAGLYRALAQLYGLDPAEWKS